MSNMKVVINKKFGGFGLSVLAMNKCIDYGITNSSQ